MSAVSDSCQSELSRPLSLLGSVMEGDLHCGELMRLLYATDASAYQEMPLAVAIPKCEADLEHLIDFAREHSVGLIPRTAGTSLAGQVVGNGIVVDVSRHFTKILEIDADQRRVRVQPGVIRNELNQALKPYGLLFGPETSTQNRAMIGGMMGNNSCGSNSVKYGSVREHLVEVTGYLSDGSKVTFGSLDAAAFAAKCDAPDSLETRIYRHARDLLGKADVRSAIVENFPKPGIERRNTGYALDLLMDAQVFDPASDQPFNFCKLIAGSEGTLFFATEITLAVEPLPPSVSGLQCAHFNSLDESLRATLLAVEEDIYACELIDHYILECTERSLEYRDNRFFIEGNPQAILVTEIRGESEAEVLAVTQRLEARMREQGLGYHYPVLFGEDTVKIWNLRKAGLGLLSNMPGDAKPVPVIEDTAVDVQDLPDYIRDFNRELKARHNLECVHYAHAGSGEIHLRPIINLKTSQGNRLFREVAQTVAELVKKYRGSLSGEHGDGRLRGEFLKAMVGESCYSYIEQVKRVWDPQGIFNPQKIVDTPPMNTSLRFVPDAPERKIETIFDFSSTQGILAAAEMCNGSGDCRKTQLAGGTMCPSYMATRNERDTTRARANTLRQILTRSTQANPFDSKELKEVMDLCLSCKGCKSECPSTVDIGKMKAEFLQHYYDANGVPLRSRMVGYYVLSQKLASIAPWAWNVLFGTPAIRRVLNALVGFHPERTIPMLTKERLSRWFRRRTAGDRLAQAKPRRKVYVFADEFTEFNDTPVGIAMVELLEKLGYAVEIPKHIESGRSSLSKGLIRRARTIARKNVSMLADKVSAETPLIGIEPSAILGFRDEYPELVGADMVERARALGEHAYLFEEWFMKEVEAGYIRADAFTDEAREILLHGHCHQKALSSVKPTVEALSLPKHYTVKTIPSGCCGMAGSFGYEREHYDVSMQVGELVLLPSVRKADSKTLIAAPGTSCRHQIHDGTGRKALHPVQILHAALK